VTPPSGSSPGTASGVTPPSGGGVTVTPQGYYNASGKCVESKTKDDCDTSKDLDAKADKLEKDAKNSTGAVKERAELEASRIRAQLEMRKELGSDRKADYYVNRMDNSQAYNQLTPRERMEYWTGLQGKIQNKKYHESEIQGLVVALENGKVVRDGKGGIKLEYSPKGGGGSSSGSNQDAAAGLLGVTKNPLLAGAAAVTCIFLCSSAGQQAGEELFGSVVSLFDMVIESGKWLINEMAKKNKNDPLSKRDDPNSKLGTNQAENAAATAIGKSVGLDDDQMELLHEEITGQGLSREEIRRLAEQIKKNFPGKSKDSYRK
jgi:hypothetical protein